MRCVDWLHMSLLSITRQVCQDAAFSFDAVVGALSHAVLPSLLQLPCCTKDKSGVMAADLEWYIRMTQCDIVLDSVVRPFVLPPGVDIILGDVHGGSETPGIA